MRPLVAGGAGGQTIKESLGLVRLSLPGDWTLTDGWTCGTEGRGRARERGGWMGYWTVGHMKKREKEGTMGF